VSPSGVAEEAALVVALVAEADGDSAGCDDDVDDLVVEVRHGAPDPVPVAAPRISPDDLVAERDAEGEVVRQERVDDSVVPTVPRLGVELPDEPLPWIVEHPVMLAASGAPTAASQEVGQRNASR
jgi:hypothetical protein